MNQLLNNRVGKKKKSGKKGCLFLLLGSFAVVLCMGLFIWGVSAVTGMVIESRHGDMAAYALMTSLTPCYAVAFSLFMGIMGLWYFAPTEEEVQAQNRRSLAPALGQKEPHAMTTATKSLISLGMLAGVILTGFFAVNHYRLVTTEGISTYFFTETGTYEWKQVSAYTIDCDSDDGLALTFTMRDGKQFEILRGVNSTTAKFDEKYTSVTHFAADIDEQMVENQVPRNVKHIQTAVNFYLSREPLWPYVSKLIGYAEIAPSPDETVADTEAPTDTEAPADTAENTSAE